LPCIPAAAHFGDIATDRNRCVDTHVWRLASSAYSEGLAAAWRAYVDGCLLAVVCPVLARQTGSSSSGGCVYTYPGASLPPRGQRNSKVDGINSVDRICLTYVTDNSKQEKVHRFTEVVHNTHQSIHSVPTPQSNKIKKRLSREKEKGGCGACRISSGVGLADRNLHRIQSTITLPSIDFYHCCPCTREYRVPFKVNATYSAVKECFTVVVVVVEEEHNCMGMGPVERSSSSRHDYWLQRVLITISKATTTAMIQDAVAHRHRVRSS